MTGLASPGLRVMQVMAGAPHGGAEAFFSRLVPALAGAGLDQRVVIRRDPGRAALLRVAGIEPVQLRFGDWLDPWTGMAMRREIQRYRPRIVLSWMSRATRFVPKGDFVHIGRLGGYYDVKYYRRCHHLIANTQNVADYLRERGWPPERLHLARNFAATESAAPAARPSLGTPANAPVVLALGRLHRNKAFDVLIAAMAQVPGAFLWLAGEGEERADLERLAASFGIADRLRFLGWRDDTGALYAAADVVVVPAREEPLGNVVIEAWARDRPVIAAASRGPAELITSEENGLLVPIEDSVGLATALRRLIGDAHLRRRLAAGGRAAYERAFTESAAVRRYLDLFQRLAA
ncbi:MAG: glycosyltransferase [Rhodospirillaceae bacterium]|nr:glycosyltransferase [Rhodospirillaceae bacterium]